MESKQDAVEAFIIDEFKREELIDKMPTQHPPVGDHQTVLILRGRGLLKRLPCRSSARYYKNMLAIRLTIFRYGVQWDDKYPAIYNHLDNYRRKEIEGEEK